MFRLLRSSRYATYRGLRASHSFRLSDAPIDVSGEIQDALQCRPPGPVVALETALVTHGLPYPLNFQTALSIESQVRSAGAIPATIGLLDGRVKVGLTKTQLARLSDFNANSGLIKLSRRDLAAAVGLGLSGGTTVSATSVIANLIGIRVFATGGLGGVHRGGEISWDVSADLTELGRTPIAVVSAGVKSILDIPRTLEFLETQGVAVFTYGSRNDFPGFFGPVTGHKSPWKIDSPHLAARVIDAGQSLGLNSGILFAVPIPEKYSQMAGIIQEAVDKAIAESEENGMSRRGKEVTPWLLKRVAELTEGKSIASNVALLENTALIGGRIAVEYAEILRQRHGSNSTKSLQGVQKKQDNEHSVTTKSYDTLPPPSLLVIGAAAVDITSQPDKHTFVDPGLSSHSTTPGKVSLTFGGVGRNIAEAAHRILSTTSDQQHPSVLLIAPLGNDSFSDLLRNDTRKRGMRTDGFLPGLDVDQRTAVCNMHLDTGGNLVTGVADMSIAHNVGSQPVTEIMGKHKPLMVAFDANLNSDTLTSILSFCQKRHVPSFFDPTSVTKSATIIPAFRRLIVDSHFHSAPVTYASPNLQELAHIFRQVQSDSEELTSNPYWWSVIDALGLGEEYRSDLALLSRQPVSSSATHETLSFLGNGTAQMAVSLLPFFQNIFVKCGDRGVVVVMRIVGEAAMSGNWSRERTDHQKRLVVAKGKDSILVLKHYPAISIPPEEVVNVTGAGDSFVGTLLAGLVGQGTLDSNAGMDRLVRRAQRAAALSLRSSDAISSSLTDSEIDDTTQ